jgi:hypothetical protein
MALRDTHTAGCTRFLHLMGGYIFTGFAHLIGKRIFIGHPVGVHLIGVHLSGSTSQTGIL